MTKTLLLSGIAALLLATGAHAVEIPKNFQGTWCVPIGHDGKVGQASDILKDGWTAYGTDANCESDYSSIEITATGVKNLALSISCVVRKVTKFDVCPWGMIFRNRERAQVKRPFQINPWSPGYHIVLQCTNGSKPSKTIGANWVIEKGSIITGIERDYRCPWDRR